MATPKQQKLIKLLIDNYGTPGETKSLGQLMIEAGYSPESAKNPHLIVGSEAVQEGLSSVVADLEQLRANALNELKGRDLSKERYADITKAIDTFTKNHQLLTGGDTERSNTPLTVKFITNEGNSN